MNVVLAHPIRVRWFLLALAALVGGIVAGLFGHPPERVLGSYLGGLVLVVGAFEFGRFNIRLAGRYAPSMTMAVALASYLSTAITLALVLAASSPRVVSGTGVAVAMFVGMTIWLGTLVCESWVREPSQEPVNIRAQDETNTRSGIGGK